MQYFKSVGKMAYIKLHSNKWMKSCMIEQRNHDFLSLIKLECINQHLQAMSQLKVIQLYLVPNHYLKFNFPANFPLLKCHITIYLVYE